MEEPAALTGLTSLCTLARLLPERDPHPNLYEVTLFVLAYIDDVSVWPALLARWELALLDELGFGLDLTQCAATGINDDLVYVSPKTGRAVSASAGEPYRDKLLALPQFLLPGRKAAVTSGDVESSFALTGHFLQTRVLGPRGEELPESRARLLTLLKRIEA
jgi:DNA repair protein RecO (recombination protein O)